MLFALYLAAHLMVMGLDVDEIDVPCLRRKSGLSGRWGFSIKWPSLLEKGALGAFFPVSDKRKALGPCARDIPRPKLPSPIDSPLIASSTTLIIVMATKARAAQLVCFFKHIKTLISMPCYEPGSVPKYRDERTSSTSSLLTARPHRPLI
ncbi:hypothetical protein BDZ45DRAFT_179084 [Acephala macrosclerotiorum]|nr:hypothetical protein BDZ45DRAFT_179084 [Acephala macrosclerotiorum]